MSVRFRPSAFLSTHLTIQQMASQLVGIILKRNRPTFRDSSAVVVRKYLTLHLR